jgi:hypothetical protein
VSHAREEAHTAGLCASCRHVQRIASARGSRFYLCELSRTDARFPRYPRLPVLTCAGYARDAAINTSTEDGHSL